MITNLTPNSQIRILDARVSKEKIDGIEQEVLTVEVRGCSFKEGEEVEIDTETMKITGTILRRHGNLFKIAMTKLIKIEPIIN